MPANKHLAIFTLPVLVAALGYFVDIYDLLMFSIVWKPSLTSLNVTADALPHVGERIISIQMFGLLLGGIFWGMLGDKKGRLSVLFGSILIYSLGNIANGLVQNATQYEIVRFIAGFGLAGELGAGITLVSESVSKEKRGIATSLVAGLGLTGAVVAYFVSQLFYWRTSYFIGGGLGLLLLLLRVGVFESGMYKSVAKEELPKGNILMFFQNGERLKKYICAIFVGLPTWYVIGVLVTFSPVFATAFGITDPVNSGKAIMFAYAGISIADIVAGLVSQWMRSRKKAMAVFYFFSSLAIATFFITKGGGSPAGLYAVCAALGFTTGFWAIFVTMGAEQFGTNLRATAATTVPNFVRGLLPLIILLCNFLRGKTDYITGSWITAVIVMVVAIIALINTKETFGKDLDYIEAN